MSAAQCNVAHRAGCVTCLLHALHVLQFLTGPLRTAMGSGMGTSSLCRSFLVCLGQVLNCCGLGAGLPEVELADAMIFSACYTVCLHDESSARHRSSSKTDTSCCRQAQSERPLLVQDTAACFTLLRMHLISTIASSCLHFSSVPF